MTLQQLINAVEAGMDPGLYYHVPQSLSEHAETICKAHYGSLDAAKRLHDALLPNAEWFPKISVNGPHGGILYLGRDDDTGVQVNADNPARAWLLAILRALEQEGR